MPRNKLYYILRNVVEMLAQHDYEEANKLMTKEAVAYEGDKKVYPEIRNILYDLAFLHKDFLEVGKIDPTLKNKTHLVITDIKAFYNTFVN